MPSPFPGTDPWLESPIIFPDLHNSLIAALRDSINAALPAPYYAAIANRVWIEESERHVEPDVDVLRPTDANGSRQPTSATSTMTETLEVKPIVIRMPREEVSEWYLEVRAEPGEDRLVTSIDVLSLSNKRRRSRGRRLYLKKQREMLDRKVNLVEIDLLRAGMRTTAVSRKRTIAEAGSFDYHLCVHRFFKPEDYEVYPIHLPQFLPRFAVPLLSATEDVIVSLQEALTTCYDRGLYSRRVHYDRACDPPLSLEQQQWVDQMLRTQKTV